MLRLSWRKVLRKINLAVVEKEVERLFIESNYILPDDVRKKLDLAVKKEKNPLSKSTLKILQKNYIKANEMIYPLCQDTGMAVLFLEIGQDVVFTGGFLSDAVNKGVENAYKNGYLRKSVVADPLRRENTKNNLPAIIHTEVVKGDKLKITALPKGFGSENQSRLTMLSPSAGREGVINFIVNGVVSSGGRGCPPCIIGVGIGGDFEYSAILAKKALLVPLDQKHPDPYYAEMEEEILIKINESNVGSMGLGGNITCLGVKILTYSTHIAGLPVAYNYCCHASRHQSIII